MHLPDKIKKELDRLCNRYGMEVIATIMVEHPRWTLADIETHIKEEANGEGESGLYLINTAVSPV